MRLSPSILSAVALTIASQYTFAETTSFGVSLDLFAPIVLTEQSSLVFPTATAGSATTLTTAPEDSGAVQFSATGEPNATVTGSIVEFQVTMLTGDGVGGEKQISVDSFVSGGDMTETGIAVFDASGDLSNLRVGATAHIEVDDVPGDYSTTATLRVTYN